MCARIAAITVANGLTHVPVLSNESDQMLDLVETLKTEPQSFLQPTFQHQQAAIAAAKSLLDPLAENVADTQTERRNETRRKRKRGSDEVEDPVLQLRKVYTNGLAIKQIWEQARRVLDAACAEVEHGLESHREHHDTKLKRIGLAKRESDTENSDNEDIEEAKRLEAEVETSSNPTSNDESNTDWPPDMEDAEDIEEDLEDMSDLEEYTDSPAKATYKQDPNNLNDGFFSIDDFNRQSQFLEQMDARGEDDNPSDEDDVDWDADPLAQLALSPINRQPQRHQGADGNSESEASGPTFGNADLNAPESDEDDSEVGETDLDGMMPGLLNTNDVRYADFFEPPPKKPSKSKRTRALPKTQPPAKSSKIGGEDDKEDTNIERAMADVRRDLLDSEEEASDDEDMEDNLSDEEGSDTLPRIPASKIRDKNLSTHEKQQLQIAEEIRRLEALNVSKKPWTLSGEASAGARPLNSLIEEDLDFERTGKPVPVITAEVSTDIEALIKRRILARDFDEVTRRRPTTLDSATDARRGRSDAVVDDSKPNTSLGEYYESEYQRNADSNSYTDKRSTAKRKQHDEIDRLWKEVRDQLDILANLHIKPKRAEVEIKTVEDKPRIAMEDAQPATSGGIDDNNTMLAPQEIYKPGTDSHATSGEVLISKSGASRSKEEMTREEKTRRRRREKERQKKTNNGQPSSKSGHTGDSRSKQAEQENLLKDLQRGGAKVIGKNGQIQELSTKKGKQKGDIAIPASGGALKL